jgi:hypothetical protein
VGFVEVLSQLNRYSEVGGADSPDMTGKPIYFLINPFMHICKNVGSSVDE